MNKAWVFGALVLLVAGTFGMRMGQRGALPVGEGARGTELGALEAAVAHRPDDAEAVQRLMRAYMERGEPGSVLAVAQRSPVAAMATPASADLVARAHLGAGHATEALAVTTKVIAQCDVGACEGSLVARAMRRERLLETMVAMGIEDADKHPEAVEVAYQRSVRNVRFSAN